jgi:N-dimethylarginine dimethylaminohydrolase
VQIASVGERWFADKTPFAGDMKKVWGDWGVKVHYVEEMAKDKSNGYFCRDLAVMGPEGAIICSPALRIRGGEERYVALMCPAL